MNKQSLLALPVLICSMLLASCGGGSGSASVGTPVTPTGNATVGLLITDGPSLQVDEAIATITSVRLIGDSGQVTLFSGSQTLDLLRLGDYSELFAVADDVAPGNYNKIRLMLSDLVLIRRDASGAVIEEIRPQLVGNGKIDLNPRGPFALAPGDVVFITLDFDMAKSLKITQTGNGKVIVRPVVFVDIRPTRPEDGLTRLHGVITAIDADNGTLRLCQSALTATPAGKGNPLDAGHCVSVFTDEDTGIFDQDGLPAAFADLEIGAEITAIGKLRSLIAGMTIPGTVLPPDGQCRFWYPHLPPGAQPAPGDCDELKNDIPPGAVLIDDKGRVQGGDALALDAFVIEIGPLGTFARLKGTVLNALDAITSRFDFALDPAQGFGSDTTLATLVQDGTRIFDRQGTELGTDAIQAGKRATVDGVVALAGAGSTDPDTLRAALVVIRSESGEVALEGEVLTVDVAATSLVMSTATGDRCVNAPEAEVFLISDTDGLSSSRGSLADLTAGQAVTVFGSEGTDGCLVATTILAEL